MPRLTLELAVTLACSLLWTAVALPRTSHRPPVSQRGANQPSEDEAVVASLRTKNFVQVPGPNPLLRADWQDGAAWPGEGKMMEFGDIFRDFDTCASPPAPCPLPLPLPLSLPSPSCP